VEIANFLNQIKPLHIHASEMYSKNLFNLISPMIKDGSLQLDWNDEVIVGSTLTHDGEIKHQATKAAIENTGS